MIDRVGPLFTGGDTMLGRALSKRFILYLAAVVGVALLAAPAWADAIDGEWCNADGENLEINGPAIKTPGGASMTGEYDRHHFSYVSPPGEKFAGEMLKMSQHSEQRMSMRLPDGSEVTWRRCEVVS
ncbi:MAG: hypothetical protein ABJN26_14140 [Stappiaceae bacterium]